MTFFNLKRLARLLAILLAILPISDLIAASPVVTESAADAILQNLNSATSGSVLASDENNILTLAGYPGGLKAALTGASVATLASMAQTFTATLTYLFEISMKKYSVGSNLNYQAIQSLYTTYNNQAQAILNAVASKQAPTISAVSTAIQNLIILLSATLYAYGKQFMDPAKSLALPLTRQTIKPSGSVASLDQYVINNFVQELASWIQYYVAAVTNSVNSITTGQLQTAAVQLGLTPPAGTSMAVAMQNVINAATDASGNLCNANATLQAQIGCAFAWYQAQLQIIMSNTNNGIVTNNLTANITPMIDSTTNSIFQIKAAATGTPVVPNVVAANGVLNTAVTNLANQINGYADATDANSYISQIKAATTATNATNLFNTALAAVNAAYPAIISATGAIAVQDKVVTGLENTINAANTALTNACPSSPLTFAMAQYNGTSGALTNFASDYQTATTDFPADLPVSAGTGTLTATNASTYSASVPGSVLSSLYDAEQAANTAISNKSNNGTVNSVTANASALNSAVSTAQGLFTTYTSAPATIKLVGTATGLATAIAQVNTYYTNTIAAGSAYTTALANANTLLTQLQALPATTVGVTSAISTMQTAINAANGAFPQATPTIVFSVANSTGAGAAVGSVTAAQMVASTPGVAIAALNKAATPGSPGSGGISGGAIAGSVIGALVGAALLVGAGVWGWKKYQEWKSEQESNDPVENPSRDALGNEFDANSTGPEVETVETRSSALQEDVDVTGGTPTPAESAAISSDAQALTGAVEEVSGVSSAGAAVSEAAGQALGLTTGQSALDGLASSSSLVDVLSVISNSASIGAQGASMDGALVAAEASSSGVAEGVRILQTNISEGYVSPTASQADMTGSLADSETIRNAGKSMGLETNDLDTYESLVRSEIPSGGTVSEGINALQEKLSDIKGFSPEQVVETVTELGYKPSDGLSSLKEVTLTSSNGITPDTAIDNIRTMIEDQVQGAGQPTTGNGDLINGNGDGISTGGSGLSQLSPEQIEADRSAGDKLVQGLDFGSGEYQQAIQKLNTALKEAYDAVQNADEDGKAAAEAQYEDLKAQAQAIDDAADGKETGIEIPDAPVV